MFRLVLRFRDTVVEERTFDKIPVTIGRRDDNDLVVDNLAISGHHAVIEAEEPNYYVLVDLDSRNGTFLNGRKISRERIFDRDSIAVGKHVLLFRDLRPPEERPSRDDGQEGVGEAAGPGGGRMDDRMHQAEQQDEEMGVEPEEGVERPRRIELHGSLTITSGGVPEIIELNKRTTTLGKSKDADVKCSGLLVGRTAAIIEKRPNGFFLSYAEGAKKPEVNGQQVNSRVQLHDGDEVTVGGTRMTFNLSEKIL